MPSDSPDLKKAKTDPLVKMPSATASTPPDDKSEGSPSITRNHSPLNNSNALNNQQLPPACGARQLSKLKRFLTTLQQFGADISPEIGDRVRSLILALVNSAITIEEFHAQLQEATNFPLRPFVIPFLKANLPLLQRELYHLARLSKQSPHQFLAQNEEMFIGSIRSPGEASDKASVTENGRSSPERKENCNENSNEENVDPHRRSGSLSPPGSLFNLSPPNRALNLSTTTNGDSFLYSANPLRFDSTAFAFPRDFRERFLVGQMDCEREIRELEKSLDDEFRHLDQLLTSISESVSRARRTLTVIQQRTSQIRRYAQTSELEMKRRTNDLVTHALRQAEERVVLVKRKAEEAVQEVKRQAVSELQKAVAAAEHRATEMITMEKEKLEQQMEVRIASLNSQNESPEVGQSCWNCGRKANETCSGCKMARYCGSFCQHKHWEVHHKVCGAGLKEKRKMFKREPNDEKNKTTACSNDKSENEESSSHS